MNKSLPRFVMGSKGFLKKDVLKQNVLQVSWCLGLFHFARRTVRNKLMILCYHGIEATDESKWWPGVFMSRDRFARRMKLLARYKFNVLGLNDAVRRLKNGTLPPNSVVITIDDGYKNTPSAMQPVLSGMGYPATVYVTSYYVQKKNPIFRLAVQYMFWKTSAIELGKPLPAWAEALKYPDIRSAPERKRAARACIDYGEQFCTEEERQKILDELGSRLGVDYSSVKEAGGLTLMSTSDIKQLTSSSDMDVQLHTHRHRLPNGREEALRELDDNAAVLRPLVRSELVHFCYPSGAWSAEQHPWLREAGIASATTCELGFNDQSSNTLALKRYLDREDISDLEFLSEISGFTAVLRRFRGVLKSSS